MQRYIDHAIILDFLFAVIVGVTLLMLRVPIERTFCLPTDENLEGFGLSLITVSATLLGFLLTIITVIVTFKKGFEEKPSTSSTSQSQTESPSENVFNKKIKKETRFYSTPIHKRVVNVFVNATYEIGLVLIVLLLIQLSIADLSLYWNFIINLCILIILVFSIIRSLYIFRLFLNVHL